MCNCLSRVIDEDDVRYPSFPSHLLDEGLKLLAEGHTVKKVADLLHLSQKTVDAHKTNLMKKLDIHNRVELVKYAINKKLIQI